MKTVQINTTEENLYRFGGHNINVTPENPWDKLSKIFKKYTHTIDYTRDEGYSEYTIIVVAKESSSSFFTFNKPDLKVEEVDVYFRATDDIKEKEPLIVRFIYQLEFVLLGSEDDCQSSKSSKCYYAWSKLKGKGNCTGTISCVESISEKDLVTVLLEEIGSTISRPRKLVIRLNEKPGEGGQTQYPATGSNKNKITLKKGSDGTGFYCYEHTVSGSAGTANEIGDFYISYGNNSMFIITSLGSRSTTGQANLEKVTAYFENTGDNKLLLFVFSFTWNVISSRRSTNSGSYTYVYTYYNFVKELQTLKGLSLTSESKIIDLLTHTDGGRSGSQLLPTLQQESERLEQLITFQEVSGTSGNNEHITTSGLQDIDKFGLPIKEGYKFMKVEMTPNADDNDRPPGAGGSSGGPWVVLSTKLFTNNEGNTMDDVKIQPGVLSDVVTKDVTKNFIKKYSMITVYYYVAGDGTSSDTGNSSKYKALLVEFKIGFNRSGAGSNLYIKRTGTDGTQWATDDTIGGISAVTADKLTEIAREAGVIEADSISKKLKLAGAGVATTAIGAGAIGGGAHYAHAVVSLTQWLI